MRRIRATLLGTNYSNLGRNFKDQKLHVLYTQKKKKRNMIGSISVTELLFYSLLKFMRQNSVVYG